MSDTTLPDNIKELTLEEGTLWRAPAEVFANKERLTGVERTATEEPRMIFKELKYTPDGRPLTYFIDFLQPHQGILDPYLMDDLNMAKRITMGYMSLFSSKYAWTLAVGPILFLPWKRKIKMMEGLLEGWCRQMEWKMSEWFMEDNRHLLLCQELRQFIEVFMMRLGFTRNISERTAKCFITLLEYDQQYNFRVKDMFYQLTDRYALINHPEREILRLAAILKARDKAVYGKFDQFVKLALLMLKIPRIRRTFKDTFEEVNLANLWPNEIDAYWMLRKTDYDYDGIPFKERWEKFVAMHTDKETGEIKLPRMMKFVTVYEDEKK